MQTNPALMPGITLILLSTCAGPLFQGGERCKELAVTSVYLLYELDQPQPTKGLKDVINYCRSRGRQLIIQCDANVHHITWGTTGTDPRGEKPDRVSGECEPKYSESM
jgi:hypothetical protein